jgi:membrane-associated phospholipid phosphatase
MAKHKNAEDRRKMTRAAAHLTAPERLDVNAAAWAIQWRDHPVVKAAGGAAQIADQPPLFALCAAVFLAGVATGDPRLRVCGLRMLAAFGAATALKLAGKQLVARTRPNAVLKRGEYRREALGPVEGDWNAFPSGHTAGAVAVARAVGRSYPELAEAAMTLAAGAGAIQVFKGGHFPSDVLAGAVLGLVAEQTAEKGLETVARRVAG